MVGLPILAWLYVRKQDVSKIPKRFKWTFQAKLQQAVELVIRAAKLLQHHGKEVWVVADIHAGRTDEEEPLTPTLSFRDEIGGLMAGGAKKT